MIDMVSGIKLYNFETTKYKNNNFCDLMAVRGYSKIRVNIFMKLQACFLSLIPC